MGRRLQLSGLTSVGTIRRTPKPGELPMFDELMMVDLDDVSTLRNIHGDFEAVIHVASASYGAPADLMRITGIATESLARAAVSLGVKRFVHVSAMSVYGKPDVPIVTSKTPVKHSIPYGAAKWAAECYLHDIQDQIPSISIRSPAIVGSLPSTHTHFLAKLLDKLTNGTGTIRLSHPMFRFNNVIHHDTLADFLVHLSLSPLTGYRALPVGSAQSETLEDLITYMVKRLGYSGGIVWESEGAPPFSIDVNEAVELGYRPVSALQTLELWLADLNPLYSGQTS